MDPALYVTLSSQIALERRMTTIADNVANMGTIGFRSTEVKFEPLLARIGKEGVFYVSSGNDYISTAKGSLTQTDNTFDFAIRGNGWFAIETPAGQVLTRDGRFTLGQGGELLTLQGYPVLDAGGAPVVLEAEDGMPDVGADGGISQNGRRVGALGLFEADLSAGFSRYENSGIIPVRRPEPLIDTAEAGVAQGFIEEANINPIGEIANLIMVQRAFESASALLKETEGTYDDAVRILGGGS